MVIFFSTATGLEDINFRLDYQNFHYCFFNYLKIKKAIDLKALMNFTLSLKNDAIISFIKLNVVIIFTINATAIPNVFIILKYFHSSNFFYQLDQFQNFSRIFSLNYLNHQQLNYFYLQKFTVNLNSQYYYYYYFTVTHLMNVLILLLFFNLNFYYCYFLIIFHFHHLIIKFLHTIFTATTINFTENWILLTYFILKKSNYFLNKQFIQVLYFLTFFIFMIFSYFFNY